MGKNRLYSVDMVKRTLEIETHVGGYGRVATKVTQMIPLVWAEGMVGAIPVFATREAAEKFKGNSEYPVAELEVLEPTVQ